MKLINSLVYALLSMTTLAILASCQDEDFGYTTEEVRAGVYDRNFIKYYGEIDPNQSWDLSTAGLISRITAAREAAEQAGMTRGTQDFATNGGEWCSQWSADATSVAVSTSVVPGGTATITATKSSAATPFVESHDLLQWVKKRLQEGDRRFLYGDGKTNKEEFNQRFNMIATEKSFRLMPVFQGIDNTVWDFHAIIEWEDPKGATDAEKYKKADIVLWRKSEGMTMQGERPNLMGESLQDYVFANSQTTNNGYHPVADLGTMTNQVLAYKDGKVQIHESWDGNQNKNVPDRSADLVIDPKNDVRFETTRLAADINSQWVTVTGYPEKISTITFYIHILQDNDEVTDGVGSKFYSDGREAGADALTSNMIVLPVQVDIKEYAGREIVLMGVETSKSGKKTYNSADALKAAIYTNNSNNNSFKSDGSTEKEKHDYSDDDMNDIVFLLVGDEVKLPELNNLNVISKRYFFEDLGSVVDWDFNDVVLDMHQELYLKTEESARYLKQTALLKHRCGTTPFSLWLSKGEGEGITYTRIPFGTQNTDLLYDNDGKLKGVNEGQEMEYYEEVTLFDVPVGQAMSQNLFWDADKNNVAIKVYAGLSEGYDGWNNPNAQKPSQTEETINDGTWAEFQARYTGENGKKNIPRVFVADQSVWWTPESQNFPNIWKKPAEMSEKDKKELEALMTKPQGAVPNDYSNSLHGIGSDRSFRYPFLEGGEFILWNTPTRFDRWEPLWLSEGFVEGLEQGYTTLHVRFGECNTSFKVLHREDYTAQDAHYTINGNEWQGNINGSTYSNNEFTFQIPSGSEDTEGTIEWYLKAKNTKGLSPSIGVQDHDAYSGHDGDNWHIYINKVWLTMPQTYTLTINSAAHGSATGAGTYAEGSQVQVTATPDAGYHFVEWLEDHNTSKSRTVTMNSNITLTPSFAEGEINHAWDEGKTFSGWGNTTVSLGGYSPSLGDNLVFTVENKGDGANIELFFNSWGIKVNATSSDATTYTFEVNNNLLDLLNTYNNTFIVNANNLTLLYIDIVQAVKFNVTVATDGNGSVSIQGQSGTSAELSNGASVTIKATPNEHYKFVSWSKGGNVVSGAGATYNFTLNEATAGTYTASFAEAAKYTITVTAGENGSVNTTAGEYYEGSQVIFTATPADGYKVARWTKNGETISGETKNTLTITVSGNDSYGVEFEVYVAPTSVVLFEGSKTPDWSNDLSFAYATIAGLLGKTLHITYNITGSDYHQIRLISKDWDWNPTSDNNYNWPDLSSGGTIEKVIDQDLLNELDGCDLAITGHGCEITKVEAE